MFHVPLLKWALKHWEQTSNSVNDKTATYSFCKPNSDCIPQLQVCTRKNEMFSFVYLEVKLERVWNVWNVNETTRWCPVSWTYEKWLQLENDNFQPGVTMVTCLACSSFSLGHFSSVLSKYMDLLFYEHGYTLCQRKKK